MRIISGKNKGKRLVAPQKLPVRPTTDFAKEALFNILNNHYYFDEISVLDLFAGTGNISYEFASRGTTDISAVDAHNGCVQFIKKTAKELDFSITPIKMDVFEYLKKEFRAYDLIFADPPYDFTQQQLSEMAQLVFDNQLLSDEGMLIIEHSKHTDMSDTPFFSYAKRYGGTIFSFFEKSE